MKDEDKHNLSQAYWRESIAIRREAGNDILAKIAWEDLEKSSVERAVIDGIRCLPELIFLQKSADVFYLVAIQASMSARHKRLMSWPNGYYAGKSERIAELEARELKLGAGNVIALCDEIIFVPDIAADSLDKYFVEKASEVNQTVNALLANASMEVKLQRYAYFALLWQKIEAD